MFYSYQILDLRKSIANLIMSLVEENGPGASLVAAVSNVKCVSLSSILTTCDHRATF